MKKKIINEDDIESIIKETANGELTDDLKEELAKKGIVNFTEKEINSMPKYKKTLLVLEKKHCRIRKKKSGKDGYTYEIRFRRNGYNVSACGITIQIAKENFLEKFKTAKPIEKGITNVPTTFNAFAMYYFETFRKERVAKDTYRTDLNRYKNHLAPLFKEISLEKVSPSDCKILLDKLKADGKYKTADEIFTLLNIIFKGAIAHSIIDKNPLDVIPHVKHESETGKALSKDEETTLLTAINGSKYAVAFALALFCGLRPNELYKCQIQGDFIVAENSKRKNKKVEYKRIPIIKALKPYLTNGIEKIPNLDSIREYLKEILPEHQLKDLRKTFNTRCKEYGVSEHARKHFMGHSLGVLDNTYTELSDEYLIKEAQKLNEWRG